MRRTGDGITYSSSDLSGFFLSRFATWMNRLAFEFPGRVEPDDPGEERALLLGKGAQHEVAVLDRLRAEGRDVVEISPEDPPLISLDDLIGPDGTTASDFIRPDYHADDLFVLQFTSGSTSEPKGVMLPNHVVAANLDAIMAKRGPTAGTISSYVCVLVSNSNSTKERLN